jgi:Dna[CI] antecedent, DciA
MPAKKKREFLSSEALQGFVQNNGLQNAFLAQRIKLFLQDYLSAAQNEQLGKCLLQNGLLRIQIHSAVMRHDLMFQRTFLKQKINQHLGQEAVTELNFY